MSQPKHPIQPLVIDEQGTTRFKQNAIVCFLLDNGPYGMNEIASGDFTSEDREQFAQLIGYSLSGLGSLGYVSEATYQAARAMIEEGIDEKDARIEYLESLLDGVRKGMKEIVPQLFRIHPSNLET